ncbi:hypothetical protein AJ80_01771 [Polytolypa hystricis UAMH7299]|uniref:Sulfotransferase domain-containing protein n=1 Tax=Polytolypa hystricis (strain UAMH7299) TaxID=1447883 RepID=A0A2B7Z001_POLH7|nr:hypothetical protein AJ80_01771 [Polytolypa hystricis UAMH7299]
MGSDAPRRFYLLTYPRSASNLLVRILNLDDQNVLPAEDYDGSHAGYFFFQAMMLRTRLELSGKAIGEWTQDERSQAREAYQKGFDALNNYVNASEARGKLVFVKEHTPLLVEPVKETNFVHGENTSQETPWVVKTPQGEHQSALNPTILPDEFLKTWSPTFLIRHPALAYPSLYRAVRDMAEKEGAAVAHPDTLTADMTLHWSRSLYEFYIDHLQKYPDGTSSAQLDAEFPIILDADDVIAQPAVVLKFAKMVGLDTSKLKFSWDPTSSETLEHMRADMKRMLSTLHASSGVVKDKLSTSIDIDEEAKKWQTEFGDDMAMNLEKWVRAAMPDYEYLKARRLRP